MQGYDQGFSAVAAGRNSESLTDLQYVPEQVGGGAIQWTHALGKFQTLVAGGDLMEVMGASDEQFFSSVQTPTTTLPADASGFWDFSEKIWCAGTVGRSSRPRCVDDWNNFDASSICTPARSKLYLSPVCLYPSRSDFAFSPRLSLLRSLRHDVSVTGSIYRAFRAPTAERVVPHVPLGKHTHTE